MWSHFFRKRIKSSRKIRSAFSLLKIGIIPVFAVGLIFFIRSDYFKVSFIQCESDSGVCSDSQKKYFFQFLGENIFQVKENEIAQKAVLKDINLESVVVKRKFPGTLEINLVTRKPFVIIRTDGQKFLADKNGFVFGTLQETDSRLPVIRVNSYESVVLGNQAGRLAAVAVKLASVLKQSYIQFQTINIEDNDTLEVVADQFKVLFSGQKDLNTQASSLQLILHSSTIDERELGNGQDNKNITKVDLRFDKPVIIF